MSSPEEQLFSFFAYSMLVYPITNYLVSRDRKYRRSVGVLLAIGFLMFVCYVHLIYESEEKGPNYYEILNVSRADGHHVLKRALRRLSLELHPDKNKSEHAADDFRRVKHAYDVLSDQSKRDIYNRFGEDGLAIAAQATMDFNTIFLRLIFQYASTCIMAFLMTFSEASGDAMSTCYFGIFVMFLFESLLVLEGFDIPIWLLPRHTSHDVLCIMHRSFPAFMSGCRCIVGSFHSDPRPLRVQALQELSNTNKAIGLHLTHFLKYSQQVLEGADGTNTTNNTSSSSSSSIGLMQRALAKKTRQVEAYEGFLCGSSSSPQKNKVEVLARLIADPTLLRPPVPWTQTPAFLLARNLVLYLITRYAVSVYNN